MKPSLLVISVALFFCACATTPKVSRTPNDEVTTWVETNVIGAIALQPEQRQTLAYAIAPVFSRLLRYQDYKPFYDRYYAKPFAHFAPYFIDLNDGIFIAILKPGQKLTELPPYRKLAGKTVEDTFGYKGDKRSMDDIPGEGTRQTVVIRAEDVTAESTGRYNMFYHEFGHLVLYTLLTEKEFQRVKELYEAAIKNNLTLDDYAARNMSEYFATGYEVYLGGEKTFVTLNKKGEPSGYRNHSRKDLLTRDPALHTFLENLMTDALRQ